MIKQEHVVQKLIKEYPALEGRDLKTYELALVMELIFVKTKRSFVEFPRNFYICIRGQNPFDIEEVKFSGVDEVYFLSLLSRFSEA